MKILIISHEYPPIGGGGANACMNLAREYGALGHQVVVLSAWYEGLADRETAGNVQLVRVHARREHLEHCGFVEMLDFLWKAMPAAESLQKRYDFDICQAFFAIPSGPLAYVLKKKYGLPYVIRFGGGDIPGFQERFAKVYKIIGPFEKQIWKKADALVANSEGLRKLALAFYDRKEILVIPNGVDLNAFSGAGDMQEEQSAEIGRACRGGTDGRQDELRLLFVSRLIERKGLQFLLPQLREIQRQCAARKKNVSLAVVGDGPYREELERIVRDNKIEDIVTFYGQKSKAELPMYYREADIFVFPSKKEGMPNVVLEAMSYGLPIVMTPCEGSAELIHDNGYVAPVEEFEKYIVKLVCDDNAREHMGKRSREVVERSFQWNHMAKQYIRIFERALRKRI